MTRRDWLAPTSVALLALAAAATSLGHDFTFDDRYVILMNDRLHEVKHVWHLFAETYWPKVFGGDGYRPLITALFTLQWVAAHGAPWLFHLVNIVLAVAAALAVYWCAAAILPRRAAWIAGALFAVHPVHVEVTGNVVGQSELIVATCLALAVGVYIRARARGALDVRAAVIILVLYTTALLSKEHAVVLPALLLAAEATVIRDRLDARRVREMRPFGLAVVAMTLAWLYVRDVVHGNMSGFAPFPVFRFLRMGTMDRVGLMMAEIPRIARLLVLPAHLSGDYSPGDVLITKGFDVAQVPGIIICLGVVVLAIALRRRAAVVSFGLMWLVVAYLPVSNLLVATGFIMAERTLFLPSVGVVFVAGALFSAAEARARRADRLVAYAVVALLVVLGLARSIDRQRVWKNNDVFFAQLLKDAPDSYRAHFLYGRLVGGYNRYGEMETQYKQAVKLFPYDITMTMAIASDYYRGGFCQPAVTLLEWSYSVEPLAVDGRYEYVQCLSTMHRWADVRTAGLDALRFVRPSQIASVRAAIAKADSALGRTTLRQSATRDSRKLLRVPQNPLAHAGGDDMSRQLTQ